MFLDLLNDALSTYRLYVVECEIQMWLPMLRWEGMPDELFVTFTVCPWSDWRSPRIYRDIRSLGRYLSRRHFEYESGAMNRSVRSLCMTRCTKKSKKVKLLPCHSMKTWGRVDAFLTSALGGGEWSASLPFYQNIYL